MSRVLMTPEEQAGTDEASSAWSLSGPGISIFESAGPRQDVGGNGGSYAVRSSTNGNNSQVTSPILDIALNHYHAKLGVYSFESGTDWYVRMLNAAGTTIAYIQSINVGIVTVGDASGQLASTGFQTTLQQWHLLEFEVYHKATTGIFRMWIDGVLLVDLEQTISTGPVNRLQVRGAETAKFDDIALNSITLRYDGGTAGVAATGTLTLTANFTDGEQVEIGGKTYTLQDTLTNADGNVHIGATASDTIDNIIAAIVLGAGAGTDYATAMTEHPTVGAAAGAGDTMDVTADTAGYAGNSISSTETGANASWGGATLSGGLGDPQVGETITDAVTTTTAVITAVTGDSDPTVSGVLTLEGIDNGDGTFGNDNALSSSGTFAGFVHAPNSAFVNGFEPNSTKIGNEYIVYVVPTAEGATIELTPSAGTDNSALVDNVPPDTGTHNEASAADQQDTYVTDASTKIPTGATVTAVASANIAVSALGGIDGARAIVRIGATDYYSDRYALGSSYGAKIVDWNTQPNDDSGWTRATLVAAGFEEGIEFVA